MHCPRTARVFAEYVWILCFTKVPYKNFKCIVRGITAPRSILAIGWALLCLFLLCLELSIWYTYLAAAVAKSLQSCPTLCDPIDGSPPGPLSLGFSRQEHWSVLPFPSPMHESEKWKWSRSVVSNSSRPHGLQPTRLLHPWDFPGKSTGVACHCLLHIGS